MVGGGQGLIGARREPVGDNEFRKLAVSERREILARVRNKQLGKISSMRRRFEKSLCKCPRCVVKRRIRFVTLSGVCITIAAGCYILVDHSKHVAPPSLNMPEALADEPASDASAVPKGNWEQVLRASAEPATSGKEQDIETAQESSVANGVSTGTLELKKNLTPPDAGRNPGALPSSNPIAEAPMPHTHGWQTVPLADASKIDIQEPSQPSGAKVAAVPVESSPGSTFGEPTVHPAAETGLRKDAEDVLMAYRSDLYELLPQWLKELAGDSKSDISKSKAAEAETDREPVVAQSATPDSTSKTASGETIDSADTAVAATAAVSPAPAHAESASVGTADAGKGGTPEDVAVVKKPDLDQPLPAQPKETDLASRSKPDEALTSRSAGSAQNLAGESKERDRKPPQTSARLFASLESNSVMHSEDWRKPTGYIIVESKPEAPQNLGTEDHSPKPQDHPARVQDRSQKVQDRRLTEQEYPSKVQDHPLKATDKPPKAEEKSGDLRRFALAFLQTDQTGNIADQHRFYADSVHFYREGDLSWSGVAAATRRYHQERQNKRYGTEGAAAVTGPVDGGFYVVEQPVSWSRKEGSRQIRGKSVLRLRVVPTGRGDWRITSIDEIGQ